MPIQPREFEEPSFVPDAHRLAPDAVVDEHVHQLEVKGIALDEHVLLGEAEGRPQHASYAVNAAETLPAVPLEVHKPLPRLKGGDLRNQASTEVVLPQKVQNGAVAPLRRLSDRLPGGGVPFRKFQNRHLLRGNAKDEVMLNLLLKLAKRRAFLLSAWRFIFFVRVHE